MSAKSSCCRIHSTPHSETLMHSFIQRITLLSVASLTVACQEPSSNGNAPGVTAPSAAANVTADAEARRSSQTSMTLAWNQITRDVVTQQLTGAAPAVRIYALVAVAQDAAVGAVEQRSRGRVHPSERAAVASASASVLGYLYPALVASFEARVQAQADSIADDRRGRENVEVGDSIGRAVAAKAIDRAKTDGFFAPFTGTVPVCAGCWVAVPTPPAFATLGQAKTFVIASGNQFRPPPPPAFGSPVFQAGLAEVRKIADTRTSAQDSIAKVWALQNGTVTTLGYWNALAAELIARRHMDEAQAAHTMALVNMAGYDALIASHAAKYTYWLIRPSQADPLINLAIGLPSFPSYPSNHATISAAAAAVLAAIFPNERVRVEKAAADAGVSRVYGGIHYRFDSEAGLTLGKTIGRYVVERDRRGTVHTESSRLPRDRARGGRSATGQASRQRCLSCRAIGEARLARRRLVLRRLDIRDWRLVHRSDNRLRDALGAVQRQGELRAPAKCEEPTARDAPTGVPERPGCSAASTFR